jgi:4-hydroxybenzoate polyprenyltransferase
LRIRDGVKKDGGHTALLLLKQLRPKQWTKNLLLFAAPLFSISSIHLYELVKVTIGFWLFCFVSGSIYILNDYVDREADRIHPEKKYRPMAAGVLNPTIALLFGAFLLLCSFVVAYKLGASFLGVLWSYLLLNVLYSFKLKHIVIIDMMVIAAGFVLRAVAGGLIIHVPFTPWFLLCILWLALFLATSKRRHELYLFGKQEGETRKVLQHYSLDLLNQLNTIVTTATVMCYALFTFTSHHTVYLMWTIPLVIYGIFRYLYLIHMEGKGGTPEKVLLSDRHILVTVILYAVSVFFILYYLDGDKFSLL